MVTVSDDFDRADSGSLGADWSELVGDWGIVSNAAECADDDGATGYYARYDAAGDLGSVDHWCEVVPVGTQTDGASNCGAAVRHRSGATTGYQFVTKFSDSCEFWRVNAGSETGPLASFTTPIASGDTCRLEVVGRLFRFKVNGSIVNLLTDTNIADGQRPAINGYNGNGTDVVRVASFQAGLMSDLSAAFLVDWSPQVTGTGTTLTPVLPVTPAAGDLVLVQTTARDAAQTMTAPGSEGWSSIQAPSQTGLECVLWGKIWGLGGQTDDTTPTFSIGSGTAGWGATAIIIRNPKHATAPWASVASAVVASGSQSNAAAATVTCPSVTHTGSNRTVMRVGSSADDNALNAPTQGFLVYGGTAYDSTTGNDFSQAMSLAEDITVTTNTGTATFAESVNGNDISNGITLVIAVPSGTAVTGVGSVSGTGTITGAGIVGVGGTSQVTGTGSITAAGVRGVTGAGSVAGTGAVAASGARGVSGAGVVLGTGLVAAQGIVGRSGVGAVSGVGVVAAVSVRGVVGAGQVTGAGAIDAAGIVTAGGEGSGQVTGTGTVAATGARGVTGAGTVSSVGAIVGVGHRSVIGSGNVAGAGQVTGRGAGVGADVRSQGTWDTGRRRLVYDAAAERVHRTGGRLVYDR